MNNSLGRYSIIISVALHLLLAGLFLLLKYDLISPEFKPIKVIQFGYREVSNNVQRTSGMKTSLPQTSEYKFGKKSSLAPRKVKLPIAKIKNNEEIFVPQSSKKILNKLDLNEEIGNSFDNSQTALSELNPTESNEISEETILPVMDDFLSSLQGKMAEDTNSDSPFLLEGDIATRQVLQREIPSYPAGIQKSVRVRIRLKVKADGGVGEMIILQKAGSPFDENAMTALKNWKFNPIAGDLVQTGTITFIYELK